MTRRFDRLGFKVRRNVQGIAYLVLGSVLRHVPKREQIAFISRFGAFDGNIKYFCRFVTGATAPQTVAFVTDRPLDLDGIEVWPYPSLRTAWRLLRTSMVIVDGHEWTEAFRGPLLAGAVKVQLWHGSGPKSVGLLRADVAATPRWRLRLKRESTPYDLVLMTSEPIREATGPAFNARSVTIGGFPRNDLFFDPTALDEAAAADPVLATLLDRKRDGGRVVLYAPTWRLQPIPSALVDLQRMAARCEDGGALLVTKLHPSATWSDPPAAHPNLVEVPAMEDVYPYLAIADVLVTDYSSIYVDYLLLDRPIVYFAYDQDVYLSEERHLLYDHGDRQPGPTVRTLPEALDAIDRALAGDDGYADLRREAREFSFAYVDGRSSERLWGEIRRRWPARAATSSAAAASSSTHAGSNR